MLMQMERKFARKLPGIDAFSPDLEALYTEWLHKNVRKNKNGKTNSGENLKRYISFQVFFHYLFLVKKNSEGVKKN